MRLVEELDIVPSQYFKKLENTNNLWEIRVVMGSNIFRFLGFFDEPNWVVLTHGFQKKAQKTPKQAIKVAEDRKQDYLERRKKDE